MTEKVLLPLFRDEVAPRFDLAAEVLIVTLDPSGGILEKRLLILPQPSPDHLCHLILTEGIGTLICGGIEEEYHDYLTWKRVRILDDVAGRGEEALERFRRGRLGRRDILHGESS